MNLADTFKRWLTERVSEEIPSAERQRLYALKEQLRGPLPDDVRDDIVKEIRNIEERYGLPKSHLLAD